MKTATLFLIILAIITALFVAAFQYLFQNKEKSQLNYWLSFFRFVSLVSIFLLIINPIINTKKKKIVKPNLLVTVDNSTSITYNSQNKKVLNLVEKLKNDTELNTKFSVSFYAFGNSLYSLDTLSFSENHTNLTLPFQEFSKFDKTENTPVILITDGNQTIGNNVEFFYYQSPVFSFIVGDTTIVEDIFIHRLNVNKFTYINNKFPVELFVNYTGNKPVTKELSIYHKNKKVFSKRLHFSKTENVSIVSLYLDAEEGGTQFYTTFIEELIPETNTINNKKSFSINVVEEKSKILILTSIIHPDLGMLKKTIESNKQRSVTIVNSKNFKGKINDYQLLILYQPTRDFKTIFEEIDLLKQNYFIISGLHTDWEFLNNVQTDFLNNTTSQVENYYPVFNPNYAGFLTSDINFSNFAPLESSFGNTTFSIPYQPLLFQKIGTINTKQPLLATFTKNNQKGAVLFGENIWRWRMNSFSLNKTFENFDGFFSNLIQYLVASKTNKQLKISIEPIYYANETIHVSASFLDTNFKFDERAKLWITLSNKAINYINKVPFTLSKNRFIASLSDLLPGTYNFDISVAGQHQSVKGEFRVLPFEIEQQFTNSKDKSLAILAKRTGGKVYYNKQEDKLIKDLKSDQRFKSTQTVTSFPTSFINWKWLLGLIILSLSLEWFIRKYFGMI